MARLARAWKVSCSKLRFRPVNWLVRPRHSAWISATNSLSQSPAVVAFSPAHEVAPSPNEIVLSHCMACLLHANRVISHNPKPGCSDYSSSIICEATQAFLGESKHATRSWISPYRRTGQYRVLDSFSGRLEEHTVWWLLVRIAYQGNPLNRLCR